MVKLALICPGCRTKVTWEIDELLFPPALRCKCGARLPLTVEEVPPRSYDLPDFDEDYGSEGIDLRESVLDRA